MTEAHSYVGIDVSKGYLDVAARPTGEQWRVSNTEEGLDQLVERLQGLSPALVVLEATGSLEVPRAAAVGTSRLPVAVVEPQAGPRLRQGHRQTGQDGQAGRPGTGPLRRASAPYPTSPAGPADPGVECSPGTAASDCGNARHRAEPAGARGHGAVRAGRGLLQPPGRWKSQGNVGWH